MDLGRGFEKFFDGAKSILIRDEYPKTLDHIIWLKDKDKCMGGVVLIGQPGIGKSISFTMCLSTGSSMVRQQLLGTDRVKFITLTNADTCHLSDPLCSPTNVEGKLRLRAVLIPFE